MDNSCLAHEIINPLNVIVGYAELTKSEQKPLDDDTDWMSEFELD